MATRQTNPAPSPISGMLNAILPEKWKRGRPLVSVVRLHGPIGMSSPFRSSLTLASIAPVLEAAFAPKALKAVVLAINSPGGSAVQSHLIFQRIRALAKEKKVPVLAFAEDAAASGGYMLALAADEIYADPSSIIGSIGVVSAGFGFDRVLEKIGIERRVYTAGQEKGMLDPFRPARPEDVERLKSVQAAVHSHFISLVEGRRGERLRKDAQGLFSGAFFSAAEAQSMGLIDGVADAHSLLKQRFGDDVRTKLVQRRSGFSLSRLFGMPAASSLALGGTAADPHAWVAVASERALWERYGL